MDKANIIISIIVVLCIAAAVAAYGITNSDSPIFSDLSSMGANDNDAGNGIGNSSNLNNGSSVAVSSGSSSGDSSGSGSYGSDGSGSSSGGSSSSDGGSSGSSSGSSDSGSSDSGSSSSGGSKVSASAIKSDAWNHIGEEGSYPGTPYYSDPYWYVTIYDSNDSAVDSFQYSADGSFLGRG